MFPIHNCFYGVVVLCYMPLQFLSFATLTNNTTFKEHSLRVVTPLALGTITVNSTSGKHCTLLRPIQKQISRPPSLMFSIVLDTKRGVLEELHLRFSLALEEDGSKIGNVVENTDAQRMPESRNRGTTRNLSWVST